MALLHCNFLIEILVYFTITRETKTKFCDFLNPYFGDKISILGLAADSNLLPE